MITKKFELSGIQKYHKEIGFRPCDIGEAKYLVESLKYRPFIFSKHSMEELLQEENPEGIGKALKEYNLNFLDVFELAIYEGRIEKIGFRIPHGEKDIIFIITREKKIITIWLNKNSDLHFTLRENLYCKP